MQTDLSSAQLIPSDQVMDVCGIRNQMQLWRWEHDARLDFPKPIRIRSRKYWRRQDVLDWLNRQVSAENPEAA